MAGRIQRALRTIVRILLQLLPEPHRGHAKACVYDVLHVPTRMRGLLFEGHLPDSLGRGKRSVSDVQKTPSASPNPLEKHFDAHAQGPGIWKWRHYFGIYHQHLRKFIGQEVHIVEVGVYSGGSLELWKGYFGAAARIYGVDIVEECKAYEHESIRIFIGDQADARFWKHFKAQVPTLDIVIDDGGHETHQQVVTLEELLPHLRPGGVYVCEDVQGISNGFHSYISGLAASLNRFERGQRVGSFAPGAIQRMISAVHLYPFLVVIEKAVVPVEEFVSASRGTEWQPFLTESRVYSENPDDLPPAKQG
jgi:methyltransferase family protein